MRAGCRRSVRMGGGMTIPPTGAAARAKRRTTHTATLVATAADQVRVDGNGKASFDEVSGPASSCAHDPPSVHVLPLNGGG